MFRNTFYLLNVEMTLNKSKQVHILTKNHSKRKHLLHKTENSEAHIENIVIPPTGTTQYLFIFVFIFGLI